MRFIVDNSIDNEKVLNHLVQWCSSGRRLDIATGYFDISSLLALQGEWQKLKNIRILMGDEVSLKTSEAFSKALKSIRRTLDHSLEEVKEDNEFLSGVEYIVEAIASRKIQCRIYRKKKFHAKAFICDAGNGGAGDAALVGSSNFTFSGINANLELNVQTTGENVKLLQDWFQVHWDEAEDVTEDLLKVIERHLAEFTPFDVYAKSLNELFLQRDAPVSHWEKNDSAIFRLLSEYQREAYHGLMKIADQWNGAFLCDGVGLGKTFVGLMILERLLLKDRKKVVLLVPKSGRESVWEANIREHLPRIMNNPFIGLQIYNHTDLGGPGDRFEEEFRAVAEEADAVIIDEAHNFRSHTSARYKKLFEMLAGNKKVFMLTATPINNSVNDLRHLIELFARRGMASDPGYFNFPPLGITNLTSHFSALYKAYLAEYGESDELDAQSSAHIIQGENLFKNLIIQRSRSYIKKSIQNEDGSSFISFPVREAPQVAAYSLRKIYGNLLDKIVEAFDQQRPLLRLPVYSLFDAEEDGTFRYYTGSREELSDMERGRNVQVVTLIRVLLLKRLESSLPSFRETCENLILKLYSFMEEFDKRHALRWKEQNEKLFAGILLRRRITLEEGEEDSLPEELKADWSGFDPGRFNIPAMVADVLLDLAKLKEFTEALEDFDVAKDDKVNSLVRLLREDPDLKQEKVIIFTEFRATAEHIYGVLKKEGFSNVFEIDSTFKGSRLDVIRRFAPFYNKTTRAKELAKGNEDIRILIATDVLAEGLNLQDARLLINYDLHWNPVRLMQRIGRIDRRLNPATEDAIKAEYPFLNEKRGRARYWNFLPPEELNSILSLYNRVTSKTLQISRIFGIEGRQLLTPDDNYDPLKDLNEAYDGTTTVQEEMHLAWQEMMLANPELASRLDQFPSAVFSGKLQSADLRKGIFFCYRLPVMHRIEEAETGAVKEVWTLKNGDVRWYLMNEEGEIADEKEQNIWKHIRCTESELRVQIAEKKELSRLRKLMKNHIHRTYIKTHSIPKESDSGERLEPALIAWMELN